MSFLNRLVDEHLRTLSGAEFKVAVYLYRQLERRQQVEMTLKQLAQATGVCPKQVYVVAKRLRESGLLRVDSRRGYATTYRLPSVLPPPVPVGVPSAAPASPPPRSPVAPERQPPPVPPSTVTPAAGPTPPANSVGPDQKPDATRDKLHQPRLPHDSTPPPPPVMTEHELCRQLASELMGGRPVDDGLLANLNAIMEFQSSDPQALLRGLLELKTRERTTLDPSELIRAIRSLSWL